MPAVPATEFIWMAASFASPIVRSSAQFLPFGCGFDAATASELTLTLAGPAAATGAMQDWLTGGVFPITATW